jgi:DNA invertase Pin-like site-specific DNA recombinase
MIRRECALHHFNRPYHFVGAKIYREKVTGAHNDRRELLDMLKHLAPGDVVTVTRIDRLARSTFDLFAIVKEIVDAKAQFRSLAEPWADTGTSTGRLMIAVLGGLADVERDLIRTRTAEGRSRAQKRGQLPARQRRGRSTSRSGLPNSIEPT